MDNRTSKFEGQNGTMLIGPEGITIKRNTQQALAARSRRTVELKYKDLAEIKHRRASIRPGELQLNLKEGAEGVTPLNRITKIGYSRDQTHKFRRARDIIKAHMSRYAENEANTNHLLNELESGFEPNLDHPNNDQERTSVSTKGLPFRK